MSATAMSVGRFLQTLAYAGHSAMIADYHQGQSLMETLLANGLDRVFLTDWKPATEDTKDLEIVRLRGTLRK